LCLLGLLQGVKLTARTDQQTSRGMATPQMIIATGSSTIQSELNIRHNRNHKDDQHTQRVSDQWFTIVKT